MNLRNFLPLAASVAALTAHAQQLALQPGEHVSIIGNALADRMQHTGFLEAMIHAKLPDAKLVFRNLAVAGDEVDTWWRSQEFGSRDQWLTWMQTDVIFAFYGFNESFKGYDGLEDFKKKLDAFLKDMAKQNYSGKGAPRVVLFSPIANEKHLDPNFADPTAANTNLKNYTDAMAEVAKANGVQFVDLFTPSQQIFAQAAAKGSSLTINGLHLSETGDAALAGVMFQQLFGTPQMATHDFQKLRAAVNEKNWQWHQRYRTVDGFNVYGGRSREKYAPKGKDGKTIGDPIFNNPVMQREMQMRDVLTANRDQRVWALAKGTDLKVNDSNVPPPIPVATNKPGDKDDLSHTYPSGEEQIAKIKKNANVTVSLFADEKQFPELVNPVQMAWDTKGRLWVAAWKTYPEREPLDPVGDRLLVFEDTNRDGKADKCTTFMDNLNSPTGFTFYKDGVLLMQAPDLWFVRDTNGDGKADWKERVLMGMDSADSHHTTNAMGLDPGGATYLSDGVFHRTQVETALGPLRHKDAIIWRFEPRTAKMEKYAPYGLVNPHGKAWDRWGNDILTNATGNANFFGPAISGHLDEGDHPGMKEFWKRPARPCPGTGMVSSRHFPDDWQGNFLNLNVISDQCIYRVKVEQDGSGLKGETVEKLVYGEPAELPTFRPICVSNGPDGALYFCDWSQTIIGHLQHHLRDPNRDHQHGRIYRITYNGRDLLTPPKIDGQPIPALLDLLKTHEDDTRTLAKVELGEHDSAQVIAAVKKWAASLDKSDQEYEHHLTEALWLHQWHNVVDAGFLRARLQSPNPQARAAAVRVLCYWRDRVPDALALLKAAAVDEDPRVRLHAVRAASFFKGKQAPEAMQVALNSLGKASDYYLDYVFKETMRQLRTQTKENVLPNDPIVLATYLGKLTDKELAAAPEIEAVFTERIGRKSTDAAARDAALTKLAALRKTDKTTEIVAALQRSAAAADDLAKALTTATPADLAKSRASLTALASNAEQKPVRRAATAALIVADANPTASWSAAKDDAAKQNVIEAIGAITDPTLRAKFQPILTASLTNNSLRPASLRALPLMGAENAKANFAVLAAAVREGKDRTIATRALMQLPRDAWDKTAAQPVAEAILAYAKTVEPKDRTKQDYIEITQLGGELASLLPPADAVRIRKELRGLGVAIFVLHTVHEQMRYDQNRLVVEAGKPFEIILENPDTMPHNLVVVKPGTHEKVGMASATMTPDKLDKQGRAFLPKSDDILAASKLVEPGQKDTVKVSGIAQEGIYEYVCTVPGHFAIMWGKLVVTKDVDGYLAANPVSAGASITQPHQH